MMSAHFQNSDVGIMIMEDKEMKGLYRGRRAGTGLCWLAACAVCVLFLMSGIAGYAARTGEVTVDGARVRQEASTDSEMVGSLALGDTVNVTGETESGGSTWYSVSFSQDGEEVTGWLRSDLLTVTGTDDPAETEEPEPEPAAYTIQEPAEACPEAESLTETSIDVGGESFTAWQANSDTALYLVWASAADGSAGWYWYDPVQGTFQQNLGQFSSQGLVAALQNELTNLKESSAKSLSQRLYIIIGLGVLSAVLLILVIVFAVKSHNVEYEYYDDEDEERADDGPESETEKKKGGFFTRRNAEEDGDFDDFIAAVSKKREEADVEKTEEEKKPDLSLTSNLPQIDMSAVEEVEKKAETAAGKAQMQEDDDFDIEILDFDDLDL